MLEELSNDDILAALDQVMASVGVREEIPYRDLLVLLRKNDVEGCAQEVANHLRLPVHIQLSYLKLGSANGFGTKAPARIDRGRQGITAQVELPQNLPMFGTAELRGYPIRVRVREDCHHYPETFITVLVHELSHVLLASLHHPKMGSELHTDLVPIALGFRQVVRRGRRVILSTIRGNVTGTQTATYGYLTDSQFDYACNYATSTLARHQQAKDDLAKLIARLRHRLHAATQKLAAFHRYLEYLDANRARKMREEDARRMVQYHSSGYCREWESSIASARAAIENAEEGTRPSGHHMVSEIEQIQELTRTIERASEALDSVEAHITQDTRTLRRHVPLFRRLLC